VLSYIRLAAVVLLSAAVIASTGLAGAATLPGCASGAAPGRTVFTVSVSATGTPFVTSYVESAPTPSGNAGCVSSAPAAPTVTVNGPGVAVYPALPVSVGPALPSTAPIPSTVHMIQVGSYMLAVPSNPSLQVYQIAPGYYVVRSLDGTQNPSVIVVPLPGTPQAPNTGPVPSVIH
jgi:hypothetical protein